jgi:hypothetical protein
MTVKNVEGRGWGMTPRGLSYKAFNLPSHPDHKYIWFKGTKMKYLQKQKNNKSKYSTQ